MSKQTNKPIYIFTPEHEKRLNYLRFNIGKNKTPENIQEISDLHTLKQRAEAQKIKSSKTPVQSKSSKTPVRSNKVKIYKPKSPQTALKKAAKPEIVRKKIRTVEGSSVPVKLTEDEIILFNRLVLVELNKLHSKYKNSEFKHHVKGANDLFKESIDVVNNFNSNCNNFRNEEDVERFMRHFFKCYDTYNLPDELARDIEYVDDIIHATIEEILMSKIAQKNIKAA